MDLAEPDHRHADQGWRASLFDRRTRRDRHRRPYLRTKRTIGLGGHVKREVEAHLAAVCQADPYLRKHPVRFEWILDADCAEVSADHPFVASFQAPPRRRGSIRACPVSAPTATSVCQPGSGSPRPSILVRATPLNRINRTSASRSVTLSTAPRRSRSQFTAGAGHFCDCRGGCTQQARGSNGAEAN